MKDFYYLIKKKLFLKNYINVFLIMTVMFLPSLVSAQCDNGVLVTEGYAVGATKISGTIYDVENLIGTQSLTNGHSYIFANSVLSLEYAEEFVEGSVITFTGSDLYKTPLMVEFGSSASTFNTSKVVTPNFTITEGSFTIEVPVGADILSGKGYKWLRLTGQAWNGVSQSDIKLIAVHIKTIKCNPCTAGVDKPILSPVPVAIGQTVFNLNTYATITNGLGKTVSWHTDTPATRANEITDVTAVSSGTYYVAFSGYDSGTPCFTDTSVFEIPCTAGVDKPILSPVPVVTGQIIFNLNTYATITNGLGKTVSWHTDTPATRANKITDVTAVSSGTYYVAFSGDDSGTPCFTDTSVFEIPCTAGVESPLFTANPVTGAVGKVTYKLSDYNSTITNRGTKNIKWYYFLPASVDSEIPNGKQVLAGTYYVAFEGLDGTIPCFSKAISFTIKGDFDGDGIFDSIDIDDDNDGVLDELECPKSLTSSGSFEYDTTKETGDFKGSWSIKKANDDSLYTVHLEDHMKPENEDIGDDIGKKGDWIFHESVDWTQGQYIASSDPRANNYHPIVKQSTTDGGAFIIFSLSDEAISNDLKNLNIGDNYEFIYEMGFLPRYSNDGTISSYSPSTYVNITGGTILTRNAPDYSAYSMEDFPSSVLKNSAALDPHWTVYKVVFKATSANVNIKLGTNSSDIVTIDAITVSEIPTDPICTQSLNTDSDDDGCLDSAEAGIDTSNTDKNVGTNGLYDFLETSPDSGKLKPSINVDLTKIYDPSVQGDACDPCKIGASTDGTPTASDSDGDGVNDICDLDDDNDGILDSIENSNCTSVVEKILLFEDFGTGKRTSTPYTTYTYKVGGNTIDGTYAIVQHPKPDAATYRGWTTQGDHTGDTDGRMMVINAAYTKGEFYRRTLDVTPNVDLKVDLWILNVIDRGYNLINPNVTFLFQDMTKNDIGGSVKREIAENGQWNNYQLSINPGNRTQVQIVLINNAEGGNGNDLALDDIKVTQLLCDTDGDGIPDYLDTDSDNDGCPDATEGASKIATTATLTGGSNGGSSDNLGTIVDGVGDRYGVPTVTDSPQATTSYVTTATKIETTIQPTAKSVCLGSDVAFTAEIASISTTVFNDDGTPDYKANTAISNTAGLVYQWEVQNLGKGTWSPITGKKTTALTLTKPKSSDSTNKYRLVVTSRFNDCVKITTDVVMLTVSALPVAGTITGVGAVCKGINSTDLTLSGNVGSIVKWQSSTDGFASSLDISNTTTTLTVLNLTTNTKYRAVVESGTCGEVTTDEVELTVKDLSIAPVVKDIYYCSSDTAEQLTAKGDNLLWYGGETGGAGSTTAPTPTVGEKKNYYVTQTKTNLCESVRAKIIIGIFPHSERPGNLNPVSICIGGTVTGHPELIWYTALTGGVAIPGPVTDKLGETTYYVSQKTGGACEGIRGPFKITVNAFPTTPAATVTEILYGATTGTITVRVQNSSDTYSFDDGVSYQASNSKSGLTAGTYQIKIKNNSGCESVATSKTIVAAPVVSSSTINVNEGTLAKSLELSAPTDVDTALTSLVITVTGLPTLGSVTKADGTALTGTETLTIAELTGLIYNAPTEYDGTAIVGKFTYTVFDGTTRVNGRTNISLNKKPDNVPPLVYSTSFTVKEESVNNSLFLGAPSDRDGDVLIIKVTKMPKMGRITLSNGGVVSVGDYLTDSQLEGLLYQAPADYITGNVVGEFAYSVFDGFYTGRGTSTITVEPINDAPVAPSSRINVDEGALAKSLGLSAPTDVDTADSSLVITVTGLPSLGSVTKADGTALTGTETLTIAELTGLIYDAPTEYDGTATVGNFTYTVFDGIISANGKTIITVNKINDAPVAKDDLSNTALEDHSVTVGTIGANDTDVDGTIDTATVILIDPMDATNTGKTGTPLVISNVGSYKVSATGTVIFTPVLNFNGTADIKYSIKDNEGLVSNEARIGIVIDAVNDKPIAYKNRYSFLENETLLANFITDNFAKNTDSDIETLTENLKVALVSVLPKDTWKGKLTYESNGDFKFIPSENFNGKFKFQYRVKDEENAVSNIVYVVLLITPVNTAPIAKDNGYTGAEDAVSITGNVITDSDATSGLDSDIDSSSLTVKEFKIGSATYTVGTTHTITEGTVKITSSGAMTFVPAADYNGTVPTITYTLTDGALEDTADIIIKVTA
ncbi:MAG: hypothetical protein COB60_01725, partial [Flavobacteriaceae bacterium]